MASAFEEHRICVLRKAIGRRVYRPITALAAESRTTNMVGKKGGDTFLECSPSGRLACRTECSAPRQFQPWTGRRPAHTCRPRRRSIGQPDSRHRQAALHTGWSRKASNAWACKMLRTIGRTFCQFPTLSSLAQHTWPRLRASPGAAQPDFSPARAPHRPRPDPPHHRHRPPRHQACRALAPRPPSRGRGPPARGQPQPSPSPLVHLSRNSFH